MTSTTPWLVHATGELGVREQPGNANNETVVDYWKEAGIRGVNDDATPWCAAFVGAMLARAGLTPTGSGLARSYLTWGYKLDKPRRGCIAIFARTDSPIHGHVALVNRVSVDGETIEVIGGNQRDSVCAVNRMTSEALGFRWPYPPEPRRTPKIDTPELEYKPQLPTVPPVSVDPANIYASLPVREAEERLRGEGSRTIKAVDNIDAAVKYGGAATAFVAALKSFVAEVGVYTPYLVAGAVAAFVLYELRNIAYARVDDARSGKHKGR
jgi:uncharacterized protein (TIGR02594 family)